MKEHYRIGKVVVSPSSFPGRAESADVIIGGSRWNSPKCDESADVIICGNPRCDENIERSLLIFLLLVLDLHLMMMLVLKI